MHHLVCSQRSLQPHFIHKNYTHFSLKLCETNSQSHNVRNEKEAHQPHASSLVTAFDSTKRLDIYVPIFSAIHFFLLFL